MSSTKAMFLVAAPLALGAAAAGPAFADLQYDLARDAAGDCRLTREGAPPRTVGAGERIMVFREDGRALVIDGGDCAMTTTEKAMLAPADTDQQKEVEYLKVFWGAYSALQAPNGYRDIDLDITIDGAGIKPPPASSYSFWLGMQPPLNFAGTEGGMSKAEWRKQNRWGNLAIHPTLQIGELGTFVRQDDISFSQAVPYIFNTFCDAGISSCPIDGPVNIAAGDDGSLALSQRATYTGKDDIFPESWVAVTATDRQSLVFVVPDASVKAIFDDADYCATGPCLLPVGLLEQEIRAHEPVTAAQLPDLFPRRVEVRVAALEQLKGDAPVDWSFPKSFEITGTVIGEKVILSLDDLDTHIKGLAETDSAYRPLRCLHALLTGLDQKQTGANGDTFVWTIDKQQPACGADG